MKNVLFFLSFCLLASTSGASSFNFGEEHTVRVPKYPLVYNRLTKAFSILGAPSCEVTAHVNSSRIFLTMKNHPDENNQGFHAINAQTYKEIIGEERSSSSTQYPITKLIFLGRNAPLFLQVHLDKSLSLLGHDGSHKIIIGQTLSGEASFLARNYPIKGTDSVFRLSPQQYARFMSEICEVNLNTSLKPTKGWCSWLWSKCCCCAKKRR